MITKSFDITTLVHNALDTKRSVRNERSNTRGGQMLVTRFLHCTPESTTVGDELLLSFVSYSALWTVKMQYIVVHSIHA